MKKYYILFKHRIEREGLTEEIREMIISFAAKGWLTNEEMEKLLNN